MIEGMTRYNFLVFHGEYETFLNKLRDVGVLHVSEPEEGIEANESVTLKMQTKAKIADIIAKAEELADKAPVESNTSALTADDIEEFEQGLSAIEKATAEMSALRETAKQMEIWGDFDMSIVEKIRNAGVCFQFRQCPTAKFIKEAANVFVIRETGTTVYFIETGNSGIDSEPAQLSEHSIGEIEQQIQTKADEIAKLEQEQRARACRDLNSYRQLLSEIESGIEFENVVLSTERAAEAKVMVLRGYCPDNNRAELEAMLAAEGIYYEAHKPSLTDDVPIKLSNSKFTRLFEPIMRLYSMPNYSELDPTPFFAPFFMLFFGLCLGDGGYGAIILLVCTLIKRKMPENRRDLTRLGQWLGAATLLVGILTGSFFGVALESLEWQWLKGVKQYFITDNNYKAQLGGYSPMMIVAVGIGLIQIFFGMAINVAKVIKQHGLKYALAPAAWITGLLGTAAYFLLPLPAVVGYCFAALIAISALIIVFYNSPDGYKNPIAGIFKNIGSCLWSAYNMATGLLGDTLSYVRLFALGLTGSILGGVFNQLAFEFGSKAPSAIGWLITLFILLFGHALNFGLNMIGAFVHPLRLTFVEYYKNSGFEGGGTEYHPFKNK